MLGKAGGDKGESMPLLLRYDSLLLKKRVALGQSYSPRLSESLALRLQLLSSLRLLNKFSVLDEIALLEKTPLCRSTGTKAAEKFRGPVLGEFWHKHYHEPKHLAKNVYNKWFGEYAVRHKLLDSKLRQVLEGDVEGSWEQCSDILAGRIAHEMVYGGMESRRQRNALTGEWLVYYVHNGLNYYLDLAGHHELDDSWALFDRLKRGCQWEFPFAFA